MVKLLHKLLPLLALLLSQSLMAATIIPAPPPLADTGHILIDYNSGRVIAEENADTPLEPASLTKLMTSYVVYQELASGHISLNDKVRVSEKAWRTPGSRMFIEVDTQVSVDDLLKGMVIQSGNDASVALAEFVAGSEEAFVDLMNGHAARLGMSKTHFANCTGLPHEGHITTARDLAKLATAIIRDFPDHYELYAEKEFTYNNIKQSNRNLLLFRDKTVDGLKTGHTESAGYCLVASAQREGMRLISVVMGTKSERARAQESQKLINYGFRFFETHRLYNSGEMLKQKRVWKGASEQASLGLDKPLFVTVPRGQYDKLQAAMNIPQQLIAPLKQGQQVGTVVVTLAGEKVSEQPLVALQSVAEGSIWQSIKDNVLLMFE